MVQLGWGSVISGFIGAATAILVMVGQHELDKRRRRKKLRRALYAELNSINRLGAAREMLGSSSGRFFYTHQDFIPTSVYEVHLSDIGLLSETEIENVVRFYNNALVVKEEINACRDVLDNDDRDFREVASAIDSTRTSLKILQDLHEDAIRSLRSYVDDSFSQRLTLANKEENENDDSDISVTIKPAGHSDTLFESETAVIDFDASPEQLADTEVHFNDEIYEVNDTSVVEIDLPEPGTHMLTIIGSNSKESTSIDVQPRSDTFGSSDQ